ncbi:putative cytochrome P450 hydroxylase [Cystobacter fuscus DSM 2262]|uniref:Cytochrome P450 hydroxylase n=1 Tax=Cystobacter fuscus (strain ATCC 25194 / DSM 2262 / NBRC 100088 / M29) TaxID=1242864 RepID=S9PHE8_CYSF2|nr:cytochrome P450 [Cystobacter fuscus]EPX63765.1 putative cytochrome P450 hydroxylase [Cystobacter fuscus DSM 2262]
MSSRAEPSQGDVAQLFNPMAPDQIEDPYPLYARMRRERPVFYSAPFELWVVTRYEDIAEVKNDPSRFSSAGALDARSEPHPEVLQVLQQGYVRFVSLVQSDPPDHTRMRAVFGKALSAQRIAAMEPEIRATADLLLDGFVRDGEADLIQRFAYALPGLIICDLLGVPRSDMEQLKRWSDDKTLLMSATAPLERQVEAAHGFLAMQRYFIEQLEERRKHPREDLLTLLVPQVMGGTAPLSHQEAVCNAMDLMAAGHETTTGLIGNGMWLLLQAPEQLQSLRDDLTLLPNAIDEMLRMEAPIRGFFRTVTAQTQLGGVQLPKGSRVFIVYASGNRDETRFSEPDRFDIRRADAKKHLAFGKGIHFCVGAALAKLEGRIAFEHLLRRLPNPRLRTDAATVRRPYFMLRGFEHLPIAWDCPVPA